MPSTMSDRQFSTPMMQQYMEIKRDYLDCMLLFRLGDFYELFLDDAEIGAKVLGITLTARPRGKDGDIPMAGVPYHSADSYIAKLVRAGHKVAICEQVSEPDSKGIVERQVVRIITPGTITDEANLDHRSHNYLLSLTANESHLGLTFAELTTGEILISQIERDQISTRLPNELARFMPAEIIHPTELDPNIVRLLQAYPQCKRFELNKWADYITSPLAYLRQHLTSSQLSPLELKANQPLTQALVASLKYLSHTQQQLVKHLHSIHYFDETDSVIIDQSTINNLELFTTLRDGQRRGSLIDVLDQTQTAMGSRLLRHWLKHPLKKLDVINRRLDTVSFFLDQPTLFQQITEHLNQITDLERLLTRINLNQANPKDLLRLQSTIEQIANTKRLLSQTSDPLLQTQCQAIDTQIVQLTSLIKDWLKDSVPVDPKKGNFIRAGIDQELDSLRQVIKKSKDWIARSQEAERERTGIGSLKIKFNKVFGYYIEVSKANLDQVPDDYDRKQTLVNSERFITPELKHHEEIILSHEAKALALELTLFTKLLDRIIELTRQLQRAAQSIAIIDCLVSLASVAKEQGYFRPNMSDGGAVKLTDSRHPVVEQLVADKSFVPNDVNLNQDQQLLIITGPNMAGKSVFMRQVALITLMAHIGSFVPAKQATIGLVDRVFVRSGAGDAISQGLSTFMVEMVETAQILNLATDKSLVIMDEIGRGTTTYDGISIAWAVAEYLVTQIGAKTLFATHYHELQTLEDEYPDKIKNYYAAVEQHQGEPVFIHRILPGKAQASYGISVAKLAGVPHEVARQAHRVLATLETTENVAKPENPQPVAHQLSPLDESNEYQPLIERLKDIDVSCTTPLEALQLLAELQKQVASAGIVDNQTSR